MTLEQPVDRGTAGWCQGLGSALQVLMRATISTIR